MCESVKDNTIIYFRTSNANCDYWDSAKEKWVSCNIIYYSDKVTT
jgi:hypothetical protein